MGNNICAMISRYVGPWDDLTPSNEPWPKTTPSMRVFINEEKNDSIGCLKFFSYYEPHYLAHALARFPYRMPLAEEVFFQHVTKIVEDKALRLTEEGPLLRQILITRYDNEMLDAIKALKSYESNKKIIGDVQILENEPLSTDERLVRETMMQLHRSFVSGRDKGRKSRIPVTDVSRMMWGMKIDDGLSGRKIAEQLGVSEATVSYHLDNAELYMREWAEQFLSGK